MEGPERAFRKFAARRAARLPPLAAGAAVPRRRRPPSRGGGIPLATRAAWRWLGDDVVGRQDEGGSGPILEARLPASHLACSHTSTSRNWPAATSVRTSAGRTPVAVTRTV